VTAGAEAVVTPPEVEGVRFRFKRGRCRDHRNSAHRSRSAIPQPAQFERPSPASTSTRCSRAFSAVRSSISFGWFGLI